MDLNNVMSCVPKMIEKKRKEESFDAVVQSTDADQTQFQGTKEKQRNVGGGC